MLDSYPSITEPEFAEACRALEERCHDDLNGTNWLSVHWHNSELEIKQAKTITDRDSSMLIQDSNQSETYDEAQAEGEDMDTVIRFEYEIQARPAIDFSILLSPTYRVPVLWFTLSPIKSARVQDLEEIYSRVVAPGSHEALRGIGVMGGISLANHPLTDRPAFFIHPCNTPNALLSLNDGSKLDPLQYLLLWVGVVGSGVGLHVPSKIASRSMA